MKSCVFRAEIKVEGERAVCKEYAASVLDQQRGRMVASRGKSMEELGVSRVSRPEVLSKSSDQLNQIQGTHVLHYKENRDNVQIGPDHRIFKDPGSLEHTSTVGNSWIRTSSVLGKECKVTATPSSPRGTDENNLIVRYNFLQCIVYYKLLRTSAAQWK